MSRISSVLFLFLMGVWTGIIILSSDIGYISVPSAFGLPSSQIEDIAGFIGFASGALGILGFSIKSKRIQIIALMLLAGYFMFLGGLLTLPIVRTGSNFLIIAIMCLWAIYRRI